MSEIDDFFQERIAATKAEILVLEEAALAIETGAIQSYTLSTGQTSQTVTKANISTLRSAIDHLLNRLAVLDARVNGAARLYVRPGF
ncbi:MAG TPA: hypothetical protein VJN18_32905 [Polyangiaceae bacterium]|nr:hypothetical protein [Polyangiaceae bacterium]